MKKLRLNPDDLAVDGFHTTKPERGGGTVQGEQGTYYTLCTCAAPTCAFTCPQTCAQTCDDYSCAESCGGTCWNPRCQDSNICP
ncbi:MAG TPA: hypothetical protein VF006_23635 [Longimicrobium sp.]